MGEGTSTHGEIVVAQPTVASKMDQVHHGQQQPQAPPIVSEDSQGTRHPASVDVAALQPVYQPSNDPEPPHIQSVIDNLSLLTHVEGGYFNQTDFSSTTMPSPYPLTPLSEKTVSLTGLRPDFDPSLRRLSTTIFYYLTPSRPQGSFHSNRSRIIHTLHRGRGRYVLIHPNGRIESFIVGQDLEKGEKLQWIVEGGTWKASFLLDDESGGENGGLLISETVVPGFEFADHEFLSDQRCQEILPAGQAKALAWLISKH